MENFSYYFLSQYVFASLLLAPFQITLLFSVKYFASPSLSVSSPASCDSTLCHSASLSQCLCESHLWLVAQALKSDALVLTWKAPERFKCDSVHAITKIV